jgi:hypothetical protein
MRRIKWHDPRKLVAQRALLGLEVLQRLNLRLAPEDGKLRSLCLEHQLGRLGRRQLALHLHARLAPRAQHEAVNGEAAGRGREKGANNTKCNGRDVKWRGRRRG